MEYLITYNCNSKNIILLPYICFTTALANISTLPISLWFITFIQLYTFHHRRHIRLQIIHPIRDQHITLLVLY